MVNMTGHWELDRERSQSLYTHMRLLGCDEIASLASEKLALAMHCVQTGKHLYTWQVSQLGVVFRGLQMGKETSETSQSLGERSVWVTVTPGEVLVETKFKSGRLLDTRTISVDVKGERILCTVLDLSLSTDGGSCKTVRYFRYRGHVDSDVVNMSAEQIQTSAGVPFEKPADLVYADKSAIKDEADEEDDKDVDEDME
jgi:hypothetical protein